MAAKQLNEEQRALAWSAVTFMVQKQPKKFIEFFNLLKKETDDGEALLRVFGAGKLVSAYEEEAQKSNPDRVKIQEVLDRAIGSFETQWLEGMRKLIKEDKGKLKEKGGRGRRGEDENHTSDF